VFDARSLQTRPESAGAGGAFDPAAALATVRASPKVSQFMARHANLARVDAQMKAAGGVGDGADGPAEELFIRHRCFSVYLPGHRQHLQLAWREGDSKWCVSLVTPAAHARQRDERVMRKKTTQGLLGAQVDATTTRCFAKRTLGGGSRTPSVQQVMAAVLKAEANTPADNKAAARWFPGVGAQDQRWSGCQWTEWSGTMYRLGEDGSERDAVDVDTEVADGQLRLCGRGVRDTDVDMTATKYFAPSTVGQLAAAHGRTVTPYPDEHNLARPWKELALVMMTAVTVTTGGPAPAALPVVSDAAWKGGVPVEAHEGMKGSFFLELENVFPTGCLRVKAMHCRSEARVDFMVARAAVPLPFNGRDSAALPSEVKGPLVAMVVQQARSEQRKAAGVVWSGGFTTKGGHYSLAKLYRKEGQAAGSSTPLCWDIMVVSLQYNISIMPAAVDAAAAAEVGGKPDLLDVAASVDVKVSEFLAQAHAKAVAEAQEAKDAALRKLKGAAHVVRAWLRGPSSMTTVSKDASEDTSVPGLKSIFGGQQGDDGWYQDAVSGKVLPSSAFLRRPSFLHLPSVLPSFLLSLSFLPSFCHFPSLCPSFRLYFLPSFLPSFTFLHLPAFTPPRLSMMVNYGFKKAMEPNFVSKALMHNSDKEVLRRGFQFLRDDDVDEEDASWETRVAVKYYDRLFKEYALVDLSHYTEGLSFIFHFWFCFCFGFDFGFGLGLGFFFNSSGSFYFTANHTPSF
jgi:hypothetical protein